MAEEKRNVQDENTSSIEIDIGPNNETTSVFDAFVCNHFEVFFLFFSLRIMKNNVIEASFRNAHNVPYPVRKSFHYLQTK